MLYLFNKNKLCFISDKISQQLISSHYLKYYFRAKYNQISGLLDDSFTTVYVSKVKVFLGNSFIIKKFIYQNRYNKKIKFIYLNKNFYVNRYLFEFLDFLNNANMLVVTPFKPFLGGYKAYYGGFIGFLPKKEMQRMRYFFVRDNLKKLNFFPFLSEKKFFLFMGKCSSYILNIYIPKPNRRKRLSLHSKKRKKKSGKLNVFIFKKKIVKKYVFKNEKKRFLKKNC